MPTAADMKVLLVTHYYADHHGGVEMVAGRLAERLASHGAAIAWCASAPAMPDLPPGIRAVPLRAWNIVERLTGFAFPFWGPIGLGRLWREVARADVVHLHETLYPGNLFAALAAFILGKPVVITQHTGQLPPTAGKGIGLSLMRLFLAIGYRTVGRFVLRRAERCVFISEKVRVYFERMVPFRRDPCFIPNGVDAAVFFPADDARRRQLRQQFAWPIGQPVFLFVGRFVQKKGLPVLRHLAARFPECRWAFAGWGPNDPSAWNLKNVQCLGTASHAELADRYRAADFLILPSLVEGFPLVVQEAMACGTPAIITEDTARGAPAVRPFAEVCEPVPGLLEARIHHLLATREQWPSARSRAARFAHDNWDWDRCADEYFDLFQHAISKPIHLLESAGNPP